MNKKYVEINALMEFANNMKDKSIDANDIARFSPADVRENVHAHWNVIGRGFAPDTYVCSACKKESREYGHFCPSCGAIMDEVENGK